MNRFRWIVVLFHVVASLQCAVGLLAIDAGVLAWATLVENRFGAAAARFGIYDTAWFFGLNAALAVNVFCAMLARLPWKRRHLGFLLTHWGILILLAGCLLSRIGGVDGRMPIFEGHASHRVYFDTYHFELKTMSGEGEGGKAGLTEPVSIPFVGGPFSWNEYAQMSWFPWSLAYRSLGKIYDCDGVSLEVLDYTARPRCGVRARLTVDGATEEFDLISMADSAQGEQRYVVKSDRRKVAIVMRPDEQSLGFQVFLHRFRRKLDPGSDTVSHYSSLVDFLDRSEPPERLQENVLITLNAPVDFADPKTGRAWRLFQASFDGPWTPGQPEFDQLADPAHPRDQIYLSQLSVNYDPGRGVKYVGSLLIVAGIVAVCLHRWRRFRSGSPVLAR